MGAKLYNDLPIDVRIAKNKRDFKEKLDTFVIKEQNNLVKQSRLLENHHGLLMRYLFMVIKFKLGF